MSIPPVLRFAHVILSGALSPGDVAIDATVGNGHDTTFLADCVGPKGRVFGFDIQEQALERTAGQMSNGRSRDNVTLIHGGHERMKRAIPEDLHGEVSAVAFNLGYLPGGDHSVTTQPETTIRALSQACALIRDDGVITAVLYTGHPGGEEEAEEVLDWTKGLPSDEYLVMSYQPVNQSDPPCLIAIERRGTK